MPGPHLGDSTAPLALSELGRLISRIEDKELRIAFADWAATHIEAVHISSRTPKGDSPMPGLDEWTRRMFLDRTAGVLREKIGHVTRESEDGKWILESIGLVIIKD